MILVESFIGVVLQTFGAILAAVFLGLLAYSPMIYIHLKEIFKQSRCKHENYSYYETMSCDAKCSNCRKNLGFIGTVRKERAAKYV